MDLPPGFRFHPTDEEIITYYLTPKIVDHSFSPTAIVEVQFNKCEPWHLPSKVNHMGEKELYFYSHKDRKYPTGMRTNRATEAGYWKGTGKDKEIYRGNGFLVGMKKTLVFYKGRAPKGEKSNWVMHEFRLEGSSSLPNLPQSAKDEWVVCRVIDKSTGARRSPSESPGLERRINSFAEELWEFSDTLPPLMDPRQTEHSSMIPSSSTTPTMMKMENQLNVSHQLIESNPQEDYLHHHAAIRKHCKMEQYYSRDQFMGGYCASQDTGPRTANNATDIAASVVSKHFDDFILEDDWTSYGFSNLIMDKF